MPIEKRVEHLLTTARKNIRIFCIKGTKMSFTKESATERAKRDLAERLDLADGSVREVSVTEKDFPDMSLGAPVDGEMSAQMISTGWEIKLGTGEKSYEYRADKHQLRLCDFEGGNHVIE